MTHKSVLDMQCMAGGLASEPLHEASCCVPGGPHDRSRPPGMRAHDRPRIGSRCLI